MVLLESSPWNLTRSKIERIATGTYTPLREQPLRIVRADLNDYDTGTLRGATSILVLCGTWTCF